MKANETRDLAARLVCELTAKEWTISTAESCTGGLIAAAVTDIPGSSAVLAGGCVSYTEDVKHRVLGVSEEILRAHSAVSPECAVAMAEGAKTLFATDLAVSATGYAGPGGGTEKDPVGTVYLALATAKKTVWKRIFLPNATRNEVREAAVKTALKMAINA